MNRQRRCVYLLVTLLAASATSRALAAVEDDFYKAAFLQSEKRDFAPAAELFAQVAGDEQAPQAMQTAAQHRLAECREEIAAADLASLMPAEAILYVQVANVGAQATTILETLGLVNDRGTAAQATDRLPIEPGVSLPYDFAVSPALVRELGKLGGAAMAITGFDERGVPQGVAAVHLGGSDLVRGLVETGLQIVTPSDAIGQFATYRIPVEGDHVWMVNTERLLLVAHSREAVAAAVGRIGENPQSPSLKESEIFRNAADARGNSLVFAWADSQRAAPIVDRLMSEELRDEELIAARTILNLPSIECATFAIGATDGGLNGHAAVRFKPGHQHLLYGLVRTAPVGEEALRHVPADAAVVAAIGLNQPLAPVDRGESEEESDSPQLALMDIGRELFANVRSITAFIAPSDAEVPEIGVVVYAQDAAKSHELWTRLMSLPAQFGAVPAGAVQETDLRGRKAEVYAYPDAPPIVVVRPSDDALLVGTAGAVEASLTALDEGKSLAARGDGAILMAGASPATSKALFIRGGQALRCVLPTMSGHERREAAKIAPLLENLTASLVVDEQTNELRVTAEIAGVPQVSEVLRAVGGPGAQTEHTANAAP